jgi:hypothetical protein
VSGLGYVGRSAPAMPRARRTSPPRTHPSPVLAPPTPEGPLRPLYLRGLRLAAPPRRGIVPLAGRPDLPLGHTSRDPQLATIEKAEMVAAVEIWACEMMMEPRGADARRLLGRHLETLRHLCGTGPLRK